MKTKKTKLVALLALATVCGATAVASLNVQSADAALRSRNVFEDKFEIDVINENNWMQTVEEGEESKLSMLYGGDNGTVTVASKSGWTFYTNGIYYDKAVEVADDEDLVIEYDLLNDGQAYYFGLIKGLQTADDGTVSRTADVTLESLFAFASNGQTLMGMQDGTIRGLISQTSRSDELKTFLGGLKGNEAWGSGFYYNNFTYGVNLKHGEDVNKTNVSFRTAGYTYKHVYLATGGYECYRKPIVAEGEEAGEWELILKTADTYAEDSAYSQIEGVPANEKIFTARSGKIGFTWHGENSQSTVEIDNFKVSTVKDQTETVEIEEDFDRAVVDGAIEAYDTSAWGDLLDQGGGAITNYPSGGLVVDNPANNDYLYTVATVMLNYDGLYDNYAVVNAEMRLDKLAGEKEIGLLFGGLRSSDRFETDGNVYVYFALNEEGKVTLNVDLVKDGARVAAGEPVVTNIVLPEAVEGSEDAPVGSKIGLTVSGKLAGKIEVSLTIDGAADVSGTFGGKDAELILRNRFAIVTDGEEEGDDVYALFSKVSAYNKWYYLMEDSVPQTVAENFDGTDGDGDPYFDENNIYLISNVGGMASDTERGVYVEDGQLKFVAAGQGGGVAVRYAYDNWTMTFDITDMQREVIYDTDGETIIRTVSNAPIVIAFGMQAEGVGYTTGKAITLNFSTTTDGEHISYRATDPLYAHGVGLPTVPTEVIGIQGNVGTKVKEGFARHQFLDPALEGYTIRVQVAYYNGRLTCGYVVMGLEDYEMLYQPVLEYVDVEGEGYVGITTTHTPEGDFQGTFTIDNLRVTDTSEMSEMVTTNKPAEPEPELPPVDSGKGEKDESGCGASVSFTLPMLFVLLGVCMVCLFRKRKTE